MAEIEQKLAWRLDRDDIQGRTIVVPLDHAAVVRNSQRFQLVALSGNYTVQSRWDRLLKRNPLPVWLVSQRVSMLHPQLRAFMTQDGQLVEANIMLRVRISDPEFFLQALANNQEQICASTIEALVSRDLNHWLPSRSKQYTLDILQSQPQELLLRDLRSIMQRALTDTGIEVRAGGLLTFQRAPAAIEIAGRQTKGQPLDHLQLEPQISAKARADEISHQTLAAAPILLATAATAALAEPHSNDLEDGQGGQQNLVNDRMEQPETGTMLDESTMTAAQEALPMATEDVIDAWVHGLRALAAAATLFATAAVFFNIELFKDPNVTQLVVAGVGFGVAFSSYLLARLRVHIRRNRLSISPSLGLIRNRLIPNFFGLGEKHPAPRRHQEQASETAQIASRESHSAPWTVKLAENKWSKIVLTPSTAAVASNTETEGLVTLFELAGKERQELAELPIQPAQSMRFISPITDATLVENSLLLICTRNSFHLTNLTSQSTFEFQTETGPITTTPLVYDSSIYLMTHDLSKGSYIARFDLKARAYVQQGLISEWAVRIPAVELGGWLYVMDSNQLHGHLYRVDSDSLSHQAIYKAEHKVTTPLAVDRRRHLIWVCDVHGQCVAVDNQGKIMQRVVLPGAARSNQAPLAMHDQTLFVVERDVFKVKVGAKSAHHFVTMPAPVVSVTEVEPELLCIVDQEGQVKVVASDGKVRLSQRLWPAGLERVTGVTCHPSRQELFVTFSQSGVHVLDIRPAFQLG